MRQRKSMLRMGSISHRRRGPDIENTRWLIAGVGWEAAATDADRDISVRHHFPGVGTYRCSGGRFHDTRVMPADIGHSKHPFGVGHGRNEQEGGKQKGGALHGFVSSGEGLRISGKCSLIKGNWATSAAYRAVSPEADAV